MGAGLGLNAGLWSQAPNRHTLKRKRLLHWIPAYQSAFCQYSTIQVLYFATLWTDGKPGKITFEGIVTSSRLLNRHSLVSFNFFYQSAGTCFCLTFYAKSLRFLHPLIPFLRHTLIAYSIDWCTFTPVLRRLFVFKTFPLHRLLPNLIRRKADMSYQWKATGFVAHVGSKEMLLTGNLTQLNL